MNPDIQNMRRLINKTFVLIVLTYCILPISASYEYMTCESCSSSDKYLKICSVANNLHGYDSTAKSEYYGACCSSDAVS